MTGLWFQEHEGTMERDSRPLWYKTRLLSLRNHAIRRYLTYLRLHVEVLIQSPTCTVSYLIQSVHARRMYDEALDLSLAAPSD